MAKLGSEFIRCAMGPVNYAGTCLLANRVEEGLRELSQDSLLGGVNRGIATVARRVGVDRTVVEEMLPMSELRATADHIAEKQRVAAASWNQYAGHLGGLLDTVAELTVDGRAVDVALTLHRLAQRLKQDEPLSEPLEALSTDIRTWQQLVEQSRQALSDQRSLEAAFRRRRMQQMLIVGGASAVIVMALGTTVFTYFKRKSIDAELAQASVDPCRVMKLEGDALTLASSSQERSVADLRHACEERREATRVEEAKAAEADRVRREQEEKVLARKKACSTLLEHVRSQRLDDADVALLGDAAPVWRRVAARELVSGDYGPSRIVIPCDDEPEVAGALRALVEDAWLADDVGWAKHPSPSVELQATLRRRVDELTMRSKMLLAEDAERDASEAVEGGRPEAIGRAALRCRLTKALAMPGRGSCAAAINLAAADDDIAVAPDE